jgi:PKD domain
MRALMLRIALALATTASLALLAAGGAQAIVIDTNASGASVPFDSSQSTSYTGVALVPGTPLTDLSAANVPVVTSNAPCSDPALTADFGNSLPTNGICFHGGSVLHANETFAMTWDPDRRYWESTRDYVEQFLSDVAAGSGTLTSPYAVAGQYTDGSGRAANKSLYGGGCIDYGNPGGYTCKFGDTNDSGVGSDYPANGCTPSGTNQYYEEPDGSYGTAPNDVCLTDGQIQTELAGGGSWQGMTELSGLLSRVAAGYTPLLVVLTPPGVEVCLDAAGTVCSANGSSPVRFCSYHSQVDVGGTEIPYVVQPWTASWYDQVGCDDPDIQPIPFLEHQVLTPAEALTLAQDVGQRLVSPISQGQIAAMTNPFLDAWFGLGGSEINDNGCIPEAIPPNADQATVGTSSQNPYYLQREFNNAGVLESDPNAPTCAVEVALQPEFVVPSTVHSGDEVQFDGSATTSTLIVPKADYQWNFGDGSNPLTVPGPSVVHVFKKGGTFDVTLTVTDRGGNVAKLTQEIHVTGPGTVSGTGKGAALKAKLLLMPESLKSVLGSGISMHVTVNEKAAGFITVSITRGEARSAHIAGRGSSVVIGRGTVSQLKNGTASLRLRMARGVAAKLKHLRHVTLTVRLALVGTAGDHLAIDAAGRY